MEEEKKDATPAQKAQTRANQAAQNQAQAGQGTNAKADETKKQPHNIVTDFYDSINVSVQQLNIALVVLCVFILVVIIAAAKLGI